MISISPGAHTPRRRPTGRAYGACHLRSTSAEQFAAGAGQVARRRRPVTHACIEAIPIPGWRLTLLTRRPPTGGEQSDDRSRSSTSLSRSRAFGLSVAFRAVVAEAGGESVESSRPLALDVAGECLACDTLGSEGSSMFDDASVDRHEC